MGLDELEACSISHFSLQPLSQQGVFCQRKSVTFRQWEWIAVAGVESHDNDKHAPGTPKRKVGGHRSDCTMNSRCPQRMHSITDG